MDIDIDFPTTYLPTLDFMVTNASMVRNGDLKKHPCGCYFQNIPVDPITKLAAIPYKQASDYGFTKIDFLHLSILDKFDNKREIRTLLATEPQWGLLLKSSVVDKLFQLNNNHELVRTVAPKSILQLADCISIIRPGKLHLLDAYVKNPTAARRKLYIVEPGDVYSYKKGHAIAYAMIVVLQLHLIKAELL